MEKFEDDFHNADSSFDDILDFDFLKIDENNDRIIELSDDDFYYRSLEEY